MEQTNKNSFVRQLQSQAKKQARLEKRQLLPRKLSFAAEIMVKYPWQSLLFLSAITAAAIELLFKIMAA